jgi:hypothetical protein
MADRESPTTSRNPRSHNPDPVPALPTLDQVLRAIRHPRRRQLLDALKYPRRPFELVREFGETNATIAHHLALLLRLNCIEVASERQQAGLTHRSYRATVSVVVVEEPDGLSISVTPASGREWPQQLCA